MTDSLDYPGVGPEHSFLKDAGRAEYYSVTDDEALEGMKILFSFTYHSFKDIHMPSMMVFIPVLCPNIPISRLCSFVIDGIFIFVAGKGRGWLRHNFSAKHSSVLT